MFFRKRTKVPVFLESLIGRRLLTGNGTFVYEDFYNEYREILRDTLSDGTSGGKGASENTVAGSDIFVNRFIGTFLWIVKYRVLSNMFNSPRRQAYLDLNFDLAMPEIVDKCFFNYDTEAIKESYDGMDIGCKKTYTGEMQKNEKPRFLVSPVWARDPDPHPLRVAAGLFIKETGLLASGQTSEDPVPAALIDAIERKFIAMTDSAAEAAKGVTLT
ncbi:MAG: hypothetical protein PVJ01_05680 [Pseudomonadota bacterium]|jgi:hypothetical protein